MRREVVERIDRRYIGDRVRNEIKCERVMYININIYIYIYIYINFIMYYVLCNTFPQVTTQWRISATIVL